MQYRLWRRQLLLDYHSADHHLVLLRQRQLGRQRLRLWLQQQLRLQSQSLLLRFHKITSALGQMARGVFHFAAFL